MVYCFNKSTLVTFNVIVKKLGLNDSEVDRETLTRIVQNSVLNTYCALTYLHERKE